ncbi:MAG: DUF4919 domain-containing protein, partial [Planctomycetes bacterium]|nr:DUF4919 domain-containing protein [Planctomycetota bacterium]
MTDRFLEFIRNPSPASYLKLRRWFIATDAYDPYNDDLLDIAQMVHEGRYDEAASALDRSMPNLQLSPRAHQLAAVAAEHAGDTSRAHAERLAASACVEGIISTGDGTRQRPYLVTRTSDEYDILGALGKQLRLQTLHHVGDRHLDEIRTTDDRTFWRAPQLEVSSCL